MPPNPPIDERHEESLVILRQIRVRAFSAEPTALSSSNPTTTVRWDVLVPAFPGVHIQLNDKVIAKKGNRTFRQTQPATYRLTASLRGISLLLRQQAVAFDTSSCLEYVVAEQTVRPIIQRLVDAVIESDRNLTLRSKPQVEISYQGIRCAIQLKRAIDGFADLKVDVDFVLALSVAAGQPIVSYCSFRVDADWPWWVTTLSVGVTKIVEEVIDGRVMDTLKPGVIKDIRDYILQITAAFSPLRLHAITLRMNEVEFQVCPTS